MDTSIIDTDGIARGTRPGVESRASVDELLELLHARPAWHRDALCVEPAYADVEFVAVDTARQVADARAVCARCLVRRECLDAALADPSTAGVWGGTSVNERRALRHQPRSPIAATPATASERSHAV